MTGTTTLYGGPGDGATATIPADIDPDTNAACRFAWVWSKDRRRVAWYEATPDRTRLDFAGWITAQDALHRIATMNQRDDFALAGKVKP